MHGNPIFRATFPANFCYFVIPVKPCLFVTFRRKPLMFESHREEAIVCFFFFTVHVPRYGTLQMITNLLRNGGWQHTPCIIFLLSTGLLANAADMILPSFPLNPAPSRLLIWGVGGGLLCPSLASAKSECARVPSPNEKKRNETKRGGDASSATRTCCVAAARVPFSLRLCKKPRKAAVSICACRCRCH